MCSMQQVKGQITVPEYNFTSNSGPGSGVSGLGSGVWDLGSGVRDLKNWNPRDDPPK